MPKTNLWILVSDELKFCHGSVAHGYLDSLVSVVEVVPHEYLGLSRQPPTKKTAALMPKKSSHTPVRPLCVAIKVAHLTLR